MIPWQVTAGFISALLEWDWEHSYVPRCFGQTLTWNLQSPFNPWPRETVYYGDCVETTVTVQF